MVSNTKNRQFKGVTVYYDDKVNYCGPSGKLVSKCISRYLMWKVDVNRACYTHDVSYQKGGTQSERKKADRKFLRDMQIEIREQTSMVSPRRILCQIQALWRYRAVRKFGSKYFNDSV